MNPVPSLTKPRRPDGPFSFFSHSLRAVYKKGEGKDNYITYEYCDGKDAGRKAVGSGYLEQGQEYIFRYILYSGEVAAESAVFKLGDAADSQPEAKTSVVASPNEAEPARTETNKGKCMYTHIHIVYHEKIQ